MELSNVSFHTETVAGCIKATTNCLITPELQAIIDRFTEELLNPVRYIVYKPKLCVFLNLNHLGW